MEIDDHDAATRFLNHDKGRAKEEEEEAHT